MRVQTPTMLSSTPITNASAAVGKQGALIIACGALGREIATLLRNYPDLPISVTCLPPNLHNQPKLIPGKIQAAIRSARPKFDHIFVAYADCGTSGGLDVVLREEGVERLPGAHCYEVFGGTALFETDRTSAVGAFFLTDFLARHFDRLVYKGLGLDRYPDLIDTYFGRYTKVLYLSQTRNDDLFEKAQQAALRLRLDFEHTHTGYAGLAEAIQQQTRSVVGTKTG